MKLQMYENQFGGSIITFGNKIGPCCNYSVKLLTSFKCHKEEESTCVQKVFQTLLGLVLPNLIMGSILIAFLKLIHLL